MSELNFFLYLRISGVSVSITVGVTLTLICDPRRADAICGAICCPFVLAPKPNAENDLVDPPFLRFGGLLTACRYWKMPNDKMWIK